MWISFIFLYRTKHWAIQSWYSYICKSGLSYIENNQVYALQITLHIRSIRVDSLGSQIDDEHFISMKEKRTTNAVGHTLLRGVEWCDCLPFSSSSSFFRRSLEEFIWYMLSVIEYLNFTFNKLSWLIQLKVSTRFCIFHGTPNIRERTYIKTHSDFRNSSSHSHSPPPAIRNIESTKMKYQIL